MFEKHTNYRANAVTVADVRAVDVEALEVQLGGPKAGGHNASDRPGSHGRLACHILGMHSNFPKNATFAGSQPLLLRLVETGRHSGLETRSS